MSFNPKEIITAWVISFNPTADQKLMAQKRKEICDSCPSKKSIIKNTKWSEVCSECGCPISKKVFTKEFNPCPLKKWNDVDKNFFKKEEYIVKNKKSVL